MEPKIDTINFILDAVKLGSTVGIISSFTAWLLSHGINKILNMFNFIASK